MIFSTLSDTKSLTPVTVKLSELLPAPIVTVTCSPIYSAASALPPYVKSTVIVSPAGTVTTTLFSSTKVTVYVTTPPSSAMLEVL